STCRSASKVKLVRLISSSSCRPPAGKENASIGYPRIGSASASISVRSVPIRDNACTASSTLLLPAALGPKSTAIRGNSMVVSTSDLNPLICSRLSMMSPSAGQREQHRIQQPLLLAAPWVEGREGVGEPEEVGAARLLGRDEGTQRVRLTARLKQHPHVDPVEGRRPWPGRGFGSQVAGGSQARARGLSPCPPPAPSRLPA